jgi:localization factor PodJL
MKPGIPWSVKGIDGKAREVAKDAARAEGLTLGEWLNQKILESAQEDAELKARATRRKASSSTTSRKPAHVKTAAPVAPPALADQSASVIAGKLDELFDRIAGLQQPESAPALPVQRASAEAGASSLAMERLLDRIVSSEKHTHESIVHLGDKVERIGVKVEELSERPPEIKARDLPGFTALEGAVRNIVDHIEKSEAQSRETMTSLQRRMAEISGKVETPLAAAAAVAPQMVKDLESRMSQLAAQVEKVSSGSGDQQLKQIFEARIRELAERIDTVRHSAEAISQKAQATASQAAEEHARAIEARLATLVEQAESKLAEAGNGGRGLEEVQAEIAQLHNRFEEIRQQAASEHEVQALRSALENLSSRVDENPAQEPIAQIEQRIAELTEQLSQVPQPVDLQPHIGQLEQRIHAIDLQMAAPQVQTDPALAEQISHIEHRLAATEQQLGSLGTIESSIQQLFQSLERSQAETRELIAGTATAMPVAHETAEPATSSPEFRALQDGLAAVRANAEAADQRTQETLEAVHETLAQIIDKLGELDRPGAEARSASSVDDIAAKAAAAASALAGNFEAHQPSDAARAEAPLFETAAAAAGSGIDLGQMPPQPSVQFSPFDDPSSINAQAASSPRPQQPQPAQAEDWLSVVRTHMSEQHGVAHKPVSMSAGGQTDFIAAARRAASAAAPSSPVGSVLTAGAGFGDVPAPAAADSQKSRLASLLSRNGSKSSGKQSGDAATAGSSRKRLMLAALVLLAAVSAYTVNSGTFTSGPAQQSSIQPAPAASPVEPVSSLQPAPQVSVAKSDMPIAGLPVQLPETASTDPITTASLGAVGTDPMLSHQPTPLGEPITAAQPAPVEAVATAEALPAEIGTEALRNAANSGDSKAQFIIASRYLEGRTVERNHDAAAYWYAKAANGGLSAAQYRIGTLYERGSGVPQDRAKAMDWYARAAEQGNVKAMHNLAVMSADSTKGQPDMTAAARWFAAAAGHGLPDSQYNLAVLNERGLGVQKNFNEAYKWFKLAARQGDRDAVTKAEAIRRQIDTATADQIDQLVASWKPLLADRDANMVSISEPAWGIQQPQQQASADQVAPAAQAAPAPAMNAQPVETLTAKDQVRRAQELLAQKGFDAGPADGSMGSRTANAIRLYQLRNGLPVNGSVSKQLLSHLQQGTI